MEDRGPWSYALSPLGSSNHNAGRVRASDALAGPQKSSGCALVATASNDHKSEGMNAGKVGKSGPGGSPQDKKAIKKHSQNNDKK